MSNAGSVNVASVAPEAESSGGSPAPEVSSFLGSAVAAITAVSGLVQSGISTGYEAVATRVMGVVQPVLNSYGEGKLVADAVALAKNAATLKNGAYALGAVALVFATYKLAPVVRKYFTKPALVTRKKVTPPPARQAMPVSKGPAKNLAFGRQPFFRNKRR